MWRSMLGIALGRRMASTQARSPLVFKVSEPVPIIYSSLKDRWKPLQVVAPFELPEEAQYRSDEDEDGGEDEGEEDDEDEERHTRSRRRDNDDLLDRLRRRSRDREEEVVEIIEDDLDEEEVDLSGEDDDLVMNSADEADYQELARLVDEEDQEEAEAAAKARGSRSERSVRKPPIRQEESEEDEKVEEQALVPVPQQQASKPTFSRKQVDLERRHKVKRLEQIVSQLEQQNTKLDSAGYGSLLQWCGNSKSLDLGTRVLDHINKTKQPLDRYLLNMLVEMYGKCGAVSQARETFDRISRRNVFSWTIMITAYAQNGHCTDALQLLAAMDLDGEPANVVTFVNSLAACSALKSLHIGRIIHESLAARGVDSNLIAQTALIDMYSKCSSLADALRVFSGIKNKDVVSYNAMISALSRLGCGKESLRLFERMELEGIRPDEVTYGCVINACERLGALEYGASIHRRIRGTRLESDVVVATALVALYGRCGRVDSARGVFQAMEQRSVVSWTVMISSLAQNGRGDEALDLFRNMECAPDEMTLASALLACGQAGRVDDGWRIFRSVGKEFPVSASAELYGCMVEMLGRVGKLDDAESLIGTMPCKATSSIWMTLLAACKRHNDLDRGIRAAKLAQQLDPACFAAASAVLAALYASAGRRGDVARLRKVVESRSARREPGGRSWIEVKNRIHEFAVDDPHPHHPQLEKIQEELRRLHSLVVAEDCEDAWRRDQVLGCCHSEKLAIGFGFASLPGVEPIRIVKNIRTCVDCHAFAKLVSRTAKRQITIRDLYGFHRFENGSCLCGI